MEGGVSDLPFKPSASEVQSVNWPNGGIQSPTFGSAAPVAASLFNNQNPDANKDLGRQGSGSPGSSAGVGGMQFMTNSYMSTGGGQIPPSGRVNLGNSIGMNASIVSSTGNRTPKQIVGNYLSNMPTGAGGGIDINTRPSRNSVGSNPGNRAFSPVPIPKVIENSTDLAFLRTSLEQDQKRIEIVNERLCFLEEQNRTFRELVWDKLAHLEKDGLNLKEQVLEKMSTMEQSQRCRLQEHAYQVTSLDNKVSDFASEESTQERVQKALVKELEQLRIVENIQNLNSALKTNTTKLEDHIRHTGDHLEKLFSDNLKNAKHKLERFSEMKCKELFMGQIQPLQKAAERLEDSLKEHHKDTDAALTTLNQMVDRNRKETVEALAETRKTAMDRIAELDKNAQKTEDDFQRKLVEQNVALSDTIEAVRLAGSENDEKLNADFVSNLQEYQKSFESKMFNIMSSTLEQANKQLQQAIEKNEQESKQGGPNGDMAYLVAEFSAQLGQLSQTVYQNAEVLDNLKMQVFETNKSVENAYALIQNHKGEAGGALAELNVNLDKLRKWSLNLDDQMQEQQRSIDRKVSMVERTLMDHKPAQDGPTPDNLELKAEVREWKRDIETKFESQERRIEDFIAHSSAEGGAFGGRTKKITGALLNSMDKSISESTDFKQPLSKQEFQVCVTQLEREIQTVASATEQELDTLRAEFSEHWATRAGIEDVQKVSKFLQSIQPKVSELYQNSEKIENQLEILERKTKHLNASSAGGGGGSTGYSMSLGGENQSNIGSPVNSNHPSANDLESVKVSTGLVMRDVASCKEGLSYLKENVNSIKENLKRDMDLCESRCKEIGLEMQVKVERLEKHICQERTRDTAMSAAYAAAERRGRGV